MLKDNKKVNNKYSVLLVHNVCICVCNPYFCLVFFIHFVYLAIKEINKYFVQPKNKSYNNILQKFGIKKR